MSIPTPASLYRRLLPRYDEMPPALRHFHSGPGKAQGILDVVWESGWPRSLFASIMRLPTPGNGLTCTLVVAETKHGETWDRTIGQTRIVTHQWLAGRHLVEQGGPFRFRFEVGADETGMIFRQVGCSFGLLPLPRFLAPVVHAVVKGDGEAWDVAVQISMPMFGLICTYEGRMGPECK